MSPDVVRAVWSATPAADRTRILGPLSALLLALAAALPAQDLIPPGQRMSVIETQHLTVLVPAEQAEALRPVAAQAEAILSGMSRDAGWDAGHVILLISDFADEHNGFSTVVPFPLVQIELAPMRPRSPLFTGGDESARTLIHEFAHHLSNNRQTNRFRLVLETIFGRIYPSDPLSLLAAYLSTPSHVTMPPFWHEGLAQWAETAYADPTSVWAGRGRDPLMHTVWRLDVAANALPDVGSWRQSYQVWPFGNSIYVYGLAYTRWLEGTYGTSASVWNVVANQQGRWPFFFNGGATPVLGHSHLQLIEQARLDLITEQQQALATLRQQAVTAAKRLTPPDTALGAPAWLPDGKLLMAVNLPAAPPRLGRVDAAGTLDLGREPMWGMGEVRSLPDGTQVWAEQPVATDPWNHSRVHVVLAGEDLVLEGERLIQPDVRHTAGVGVQVCAIRLDPAGQQSLVMDSVQISNGTRLSGKGWKTAPTQDQPWHPTFRPGHEELAWVEADPNGSRLILATLSDLTQRTVLAQVRGRLIHPAWTADGSSVFVCSDVSGVANAYRIDAASPGILVPITNTIGGIIACVPSPDGKELAIIDQDHRGPFLARLANDPSTFPATIPTLTTPWPAPVAKQLPGPRADRAPATAARPQPLPATAATPPVATPYHGVPRIRPLFWTPTTQVTPTGGTGVAGLATDPLLTHVLSAGIGVGNYDQSLVWHAAYVNSTWWLEGAAVGWRSEDNYDDFVRGTNGGIYNYTETVTSGELRVGKGMSGFERRWLGYLALGLADHAPTDDTAAALQGVTTTSLPAFDGTENYTEAIIAYTDTLLFPTSYTWEDGSDLALSWRHRFGDDWQGDRLSAQGQYVWTLWKAQSHQLVLGGIAGTSAGDRWLQGEFAVGGGTGMGLPRGYPLTQATGDYALAGSIAYRLPIWRPYAGWSSSPFSFRQLVVEGFADAGQVSNDRIGDHNADWYRSVGVGLFANLDIWTLNMNPGLVWAQQLDGTKDSSLGLALQMGW